jgi:hypothetical protein
LQEKLIACQKRKNKVKKNTEKAGRKEEGRKGRNGKV